MVPLSKFHGLSAGQADELKEKLVSKLVQAKNQAVFDFLDGEHLVNTLRLNIDFNNYRFFSTDNRTNADPHALAAVRFIENCANADIYFNR